MPIFREIPYAMPLSESLQFSRYDSCGCRGATEQMIC